MKLETVKFFESEGWQIDVVLGRTDRSGWPTRDAACPEEEC
jgi:hypothetical protein